MATSLSLSKTSSSASAVIGDENIEDACSICLEPFNSSDPPTVSKLHTPFLPLVGMVGSGGAAKELPPTPPCPTRACFGAQL